MQWRPNGEFMSTGVLSLIKSAKAIPHLATRGTTRARRSWPAFGNVSENGLYRNTAADDLSVRGSKLTRSVRCLAVACVNGLLW
jgi:hypothetical protein